MALDQLSVRKVHLRIRDHFHMLTQSDFEVHNAEAQVSLLGLQ